jgi:hypothetical protein
MFSTVIGTECFICILNIKNISGTSAKDTAAQHPSNMEKNPLAINVCLIGIQVKDFVKGTV